ncbi:MAG: hypothetical protein EOP84_05860 [Verrucomicrobiaceae bacterium]|nr:MAG: hypothetical protein EOP84_05860 [Verrucomicrobiaceae bacterium]
MIEDNEVIVLVVATGVLLVLWVNRESMRRIPAARLLYWAFGMFFAAWCLTVLEGFFWPEIVNLLEHMATTGGAVLFACWCTRFARSKEEVR